MRIRNVTVAAMVLMMSAAFVLAAENTPRRRRSGGRRSRSSLIGLLGNEKVRKELKVTDAAAAKIKAIGEKLRADMGKKYTELRKIKDADKRRAEFAKLRTEYETNSHKQLHGVLSRDQMRRLHQIRAQYRAATDTLGSKYVAGRLKLTDEQKAKIAKIGADTYTKRRALYSGMRDANEAKRTEVRKKSGELRAEADKQALAVLTPAQQKTFEEMKGKKFEI